MIRLRRGKPQAVAVALGGGSVLRVRPATQCELEEAMAQARRDVAGLIEGGEVTERLAPLLNLDIGDPLKGNKLAAAGEKLIVTYLVMACHDGWSDVALDDGTVLAAPESWSVALLLEDPVIYQRVMTAVNSRVHQEDAEGNASPVSPNGGAGTPDGAPAAAAAAPPAPTAMPSPTPMVN